MAVGVPLAAGVALALGLFVGEAVGLSLGDIAVGDMVGVADAVAVAVVFGLSRATLETGTRASGCVARKSAGSGTPWIWWRSSQTLATD